MSASIIIAILKGALELSGWIAKYLHDRQLLTAGEYKAIAENANEALEKIRKADIARRAAAGWPLPDELRDDPNNTDND